MIASSLFLAHEGLLPFSFICHQVSSSQPSLFEVTFYFFCCQSSLFLILVYSLFFSSIKMSKENDNLDGSQNPLYSLNEFLAEEEIIDDVLNQAKVVIQSTIKELEKEATDHRFNPRRHIKRPREEAHQKLVNDYFSENPLYPSNIFHRRFRMSRLLFQRIVDCLGRWSEYFTQRVDAVNHQGLSPLQKCTAAIHQLATGSAADELDEYLKIGETIAMEALKIFVKGVREVFDERYLRRPVGV
jgi:hypothetical protein